MPENNAPAKILFLNIVGILGGGERSLLDILDTLDRSKAEPEVLLFGGGKLADELAARGIPYSIIEQGEAGKLSRSGAGFLKTLRGLAAAAGAALRLVRHVRAGNFRTVHSNSYKTHYLSVALRLLTGARLTWHLRDMVRDSFEGGIFRALAGIFPHEVIANSTATKASLGTGRAFMKAKVIHNGVDCDAYSKGDGAAFRQRLEIPRDAFLILHAGMLCPFKGQHLMLEALAKIPETANARVLFAGTEAYRTGAPELRGYSEKLRAKAEELNVTDSVIWAGDVESMPDAYAAADVVVNTSSRPEPFGRTMAEGMAAGKPVVAFAEGGAVDIVLDNETGFLIPPYDTDKLTAELLKLHDDEKLRHDFGETGRERAHELFDRTGLGEKVRRVCMGEE